MDAIFIQFRGARILVRTVEETSPHVQGRGLGPSTIFHGLTLTTTFNDWHYYILWSLGASQARGLCKFYAHLK
jgi:hypothetical protein